MQRYRQTLRLASKPHNDIEMVQWTHNAIGNKDLDAWHQHGAVVVRDFFSAEEIAPVYADYARLYGVHGAGDGNTLSIDTGQPVGAFPPQAICQSGHPAL